MTSSKYFSSNSDSVPSASDIARTIGFTSFQKEVATFHVPDGSDDSLSLSKVADKKCDSVSLYSYLKVDITNRTLEELSFHCDIKPDWGFTLGTFTFSLKDVKVSIKVTQPSQNFRYCFCFLFYVFVFFVVVVY